ARPSRSHPAARPGRVTIPWPRTLKATKGAGLFCTLVSSPAGGRRGSRRRRAHLRTGAPSQTSAALAARNPHNHMAASNISNAPKRTLLENGLWVATETLPHVRSASLGVYLDTGSRDEQPGANGLAHFFEHMVFKGTPRRGPLDIVRRFEATGGQVNAWTSKEQTCFYGKVVDSESDGALDVLLDMVFNGKFDAEDIRKEKDVVIEEIRSVNDSPDDLAHELFAQASF